MTNDPKPTNLPEDVLQLTDQFRDNAGRNLPVLYEAAQKGLAYVAPGWQDRPRPQQERDFRLLKQLLERRMRFDEPGGPNRNTFNAYMTTVKIALLEGLGLEAAKRCNRAILAAARSKVEKGEIEGATAEEKLEKAIQLVAQSLEAEGSGRRGGTGRRGGRLELPHPADYTDPEAFARDALTALTALCNLTQTQQFLRQPRRLGSQLLLMGKQAELALVQEGASQIVAA
jgi:hypothetical protein